MNAEQSLEQMQSAISDASQHILSMEVVRMKEGLWILTIKALIREYGIKDDFAFTTVEKAIRATWDEVEKVPGFPAIMQDALSEFRNEWREMLK